MARRTYARLQGMAIIAAVMLLLAGCASNDNNQTGDTTATTSPPAAESQRNEQTAAPEAGTRTVADQFGEVEIPKHPQRVSALYREDYLVALGVTPIVQYFSPMFGKQDYLNLEVPLFDVSSSIEAMVVAKPDLIIGAGDVDEAVYETYSKVAPTFRLPDDVLTDTRKTLTLMADVLGIPEKAEQVLKDYESRIAEAKSKLQTALGEENLLVLRMNVADKSINIFGIHNTFVGQLLYEDLGLKAPAYAAAMTESNIVLSSEVIPELNADRIILLPSNGTWEEEGNAKALKEMLANPLWQSVPAVQKGQVYPVERSYWQTGAIMANYKKMDELLKLIAS